MKRVFIAIFLSVVLPFSFAFAKPNGLVILLNDYGSQDYYLGALKGSIYSRFLDARIDTISTEVPSDNIREGAFILARAASSFPPGTTFCVVVSPLTGAKHRVIAVETEDEKIFVAPDNGILTLILRESRIKESREITNRIFMNTSLFQASTFMGRDVYGPAAAILAEGTSLKLAGNFVNDLTTYKIIEPQFNINFLTGEVEHVDSLGNIHTNLPAEFFRKMGVNPGRTLNIQMGGERVDVTFVKNFSDVHPGDWLGFIDRIGMFEIARNEASANAILQVHAGTPVKIR